MSNAYDATLDVLPDNVKTIELNSEEFTELRAINHLWKLEENGKLARLIIKDNISTDLLYAISYNANNVLQILLDKDSYDSDLSWLFKTIHLAQRCGVYVVIILDIEQGSIALSKLLNVLNLLKFNRNINYLVRFLNLRGNSIERYQELENVSPLEVDIKKLTCKNKNLKYVGTVLDTLKSFAQYANITISAYNPNTFGYDIGICKKKVIDKQI